ncbi:MAG: hypothetical protein CMJ89_07580 [Planctomycetes bacterium]|jgi:hypothetical protein|nr:hypothetical protein [Planctomycetota bacterium]
MHKTALFTLLGPFALASPTAAQDQPQSGFEIVHQVAPVAGTTWVSATFQNGDILVFDGLNIERYDEGGSLLATLDTLAQFGFPSFIELAPDESYAVLGESSNHELRSIDLDGGSSLIGTLLFNYDGVFEDGDHLILSAAAGGFGLGNELWRAQVSTATLTQIGEVGGASGPLAIDEGGNLYYATVSDTFPPPPLQTDILLFDTAVLSSSSIFDETDAKVVASGLAGGTSMAFDVERQALFVAENNFATGVSRIRRLPAGSSTGTILVEGQSFFSISGLEFVSDAGTAVFEPFQPSGHSTLRYHTSDFVTDIERKSVQPLRPTFSLEGPGTTMVGDFDASVEDGPLSGFAVIAYGPQALFDPMEAAIPFGGIPLFLGLDLPSMTVFQTILSLDAAGALQQSFFNSGGLFGFAAQMVMINADLSLAGSSTAVFL